MGRVLLCCTVVLCVFLSGCKPPDSKAMNSWMGRHKSELIESWGPPSSTASDGRGGEILIYERSVNLGQEPGVARRDRNGNVVYTNPVNRGYTRSRMFWADADGVIYRWMARGM